MKFVFHTDVVAVKSFFIGLYSFDPQPLARGSAAAAAPLSGGCADDHLPLQQAAACAGSLLQPSRNQVDNPRERRHIAPWAKRLEQE
jgi:nitrate reductase gamma subunit